MKNKILVAGATGNLGFRIVKNLIALKADVRIVVRNVSDTSKTKELEGLGAKVIRITNWDIKELSQACQDVDCVVSALAGLREVIIDSQKLLLNAAISAGVPRFIPSDYSLDFTKFKHGENRNLDLRREFHTYLDKTSIRSTSIFNGAFMDMLTKEMPMILFKQKLILYWGKADYHWAFTTMDNTAEYTAYAALDSDTPRYLTIAGDQISPREVSTLMSKLTGTKFRLLRPGGQGLLGLIISIAKKFSPGEKELYPAWQGMQYMHNMIDQRAQIIKTDNQIYKNIKWTTVRDLLIDHLDTLSLKKKDNSSS